MKLTKAIKKTFNNMSVGIPLVFDDAVHATKHNKYFIKNGIQAIFATFIYWLRFALVLVCIPLLFIYGVCCQANKRGES